MFLAVIALLVFDLDEISRTDIHCVLRMVFEIQVHINVRMRYRMAYLLATGLPLLVFAGVHEVTLRCPGDEVLPVKTASIVHGNLSSLSLDLIRLIPQVCCRSYDREFYRWRRRIAWELEWEFSTKSTLLPRGT